MVLKNIENLANPANLSNLEIVPGSIIHASTVPSGFFASNSQLNA